MVFDCSIAKPARPCYSLDAERHGSGHNKQWLGAKCLVDRARYTAQICWNIAFNRLVVFVNSTFMKAVFCANEEGAVGRLSGQRRVVETRQRNAGGDMQAHYGELKEQPPCDQYRECLAS